MPQQSRRAAIQLVLRAHRQEELKAPRQLRSAALGAALALLACGGDDIGGPAPPASALRFRALSAGYYHTCALTTEGRAYCWGRNDFGTLGDGSRVERTSPAAVAGGRTFTALDAGAGHNCALAAGGEAWCWGHNDEGQVGDGSFTGADRPVRVAGALALVAISAGHAHTCGLRADGAAFCWGDDSRGQLGDGGPGSSTKSAIPVRVRSDQSFGAISAGWYQTCALTTAGAAWCWGANESGQAGDGSNQNRHEPVAVAGGRTFSALSVGDRFVCGISGGEAWCWGANRQGELGTAGGSGSSGPIRVTGTAGLRRIAAASGASTLGAAAPYACGVTTSQAVPCWGGAVRALRDAAAFPGPLAPALAADDVASGAQHVCVLDRRGYAWCGGGNYAGQLGDGTHTDRARLTGVIGP